MGVLDISLQSFNSVSLLGALTVLLLIYFISSSSLDSHYNGKEPPGPTPLPVLGNLLQLDMKRIFITLPELFKKYGSVFTVYFGPKKVVVLAGYKTVKEALGNYDDVFGDRDPLLFVDEANQGHGVTWSNGDSWKEMRHFALSNLRQFGIGKKASEDKIIEESHHLIEVIKKFKGAAFDTTEPLTYAVSNIISSIVFGSRFEYDDPVLTSLVHQTKRRFQLLNSPSVQVYNMFPRFFKWIANRREFHNVITDHKKQIFALVSRLKETLNPQMCRGFVDAFLVRQQNVEESGITNSHFHTANLMTTVINLFAAGTETTSTTMKWGLLYLAKYPKIQDQVREEMTRVIGSRQVQFSDRKDLPFTNAVIHETQRLASIVPISVPHKTTRDITFQGHFIKKGSTVYPLLTSVLHDPTEWERPHCFFPAHFLDKDKNFVKPDAFLPFSAGPRNCLGQSLATMQLFLFLATLLQHFRFTPAPGVSEDELDETPSGRFSVVPSPHKLCAVPIM
ncbi:cytochrome P450 2K1-like isoform X3 [Acanthochromis polyacanthus]|uniref:cytochrome P450 2K1-like isoform X3 n=1 Tax=Acanthochromis polyacanthus TaxID=80966 RepID=UPI002234A24B|nr:cytochrome P450 2K1-like isoform X3 [Acanthochromis polyacanthus]